jgi:hypothetical protein
MFPSDVQGPEPISLSIAIRPGVEADESPGEKRQQPEHCLCHRRTHRKASSTSSFFSSNLWWGRHFLG